MNNEILYVLLQDYAAHEIVYLSQAIASDEFGSSQIHWRFPHSAGLFI